MQQTTNLSRDFISDRIKRAGLFYEEDLSEMEIPQEILDTVKIDLVSRYHIIPIKEENGLLFLATDDSTVLKQRAQLERLLGWRIRFIKVTEENLQAALLKFYSISGIGTLEVGRQKEVDLTDITPQRAALHKMLQEAAKQGASDIHLLPGLGGFQVCFRINGHMVDVSREHFFEERHIPTVTNLIKMMDESRNVDILRSSMPNEGSFYLRRGGQDIFARLETLPIGTAGLEKINIRLLPQASRSYSAKKTLDSIGYAKEDLKAIKSALYKNASGLFLNTGPTGSGKTTSLHAQIHYVLDSAQEPMNVIEIAEPIEIYEEKFTQVQVRRAPNEDQNLTAEKILVASLRSDPDIILYNEIRNATDTTVAMQASNTGHRVFATVHASDCVRAFSRLLDFDISKTTLLSELKLLVSQRLVATLCPHCSKPHTLTPEEAMVLNPEEIAFLEGKMREKGNPMDIKECKQCNHGYAGRTAIAEFIELDMEIRDALLYQRSFGEIQQVLRRHGYRTMWEKGLDMVAQGRIELNELIWAVGRG